MAYRGNKFVLHFFYFFSFGDILGLSFTAFTGSTAMTGAASILVIDDDDSVRRVICDDLIEQGFTVREAKNGQEGLDIIHSGMVPALVITDILMPEKEGLGVIREIRNSNADIKLIAISGSQYAGSPDFLAMAKRLGADAIFPKPVNMEQLEEAVASLCKNQADRGR